jgi:hypothetical protein
MEKRKIKIISIPLGWKDFVTLKIMPNLLKDIFG